MPPLAGRVAGAGLAVAGAAIAVLAALLFGDMTRETTLSREIQAIQDVKGGLESLRDALHRLRYAVAVPGHLADFERERIAIEADLEYLRSKAAERSDVAPALVALEPAVRLYVDQGSLALRAGHERNRPSLEEAEEDAFRSVRRATGRASDEITRRTSEQIRLWASREVYVRALVVGTVVVLIALGLTFRRLLARARRDAERIEQLAHFDALTGLANRSLLGDRLSRLVASSRRNAAPLAILLFDLDGFKAVNDSRGHAAGDALLVEVARRARACVRESDTVGRLGGDEFLVLLPDTDREGARAVADKLLAAMAAPFDLGGQPVNVSASIGGSFLPGPPGDGDALVRAADHALYDAKRQGRNRYSEAADAEPAATEPG